MRVSGAVVGTGSGEAVPVDGGGESGVDVAGGVTVGPSGIGRGMPLQAVSASVIRNPKIVRVGLMEVLILVK